MEDSTTPRAPGRPTFVDLAALIAGFAVGLPRMPYGYATAFRLVDVEVVFRFLVNATPAAASAVILVRRFRFGGFPRAIDWAVLVLATIRIAGEFPPAGLIRDYVPDEGPRIKHYHPAPGWIYWTELGLSLAAPSALLIIIRIGRDRLSDAIKTLLILFAVLSISWGPAHLFLDEIHLRHFRSTSRIDIFGSEVIAQLPFLLLWAIPAGSALFDTFWRDRRPNGPERLAYLVFFMKIFLMRGIEILVRSANSRPGALGDSLWSHRHLLTDLMSPMLAIPFAVWLGPIWSRWLGLGYDESPTK